MYLSGVDFLESLVKQDGFSAKMVLNDAGAVFFSSHGQHREQKGPEISYEDDYAGNALAAMLGPGRIEIRYPRDFTDARVARLVGTLLSEPRLAFMRDWQVAYQGRTLPSARYDASLDEPSSAVHEDDP
jgi:hypothetical protein